MEWLVKLLGDYYDVNGLHLREYDGKFHLEWEQMNLDMLKEVCHEFSIVGYKASLDTEEIIELIRKHFLTVGKKRAKLTWEEKHNILDFLRHGESTYDEMTVADLKELCRNNGLSGYSKMSKDELIELLEQNDEEKANEPEPTKKSSSNAKPVQNGDIPTIRLKDIAGLDEAKKALDERVVLPIKHKEIYDKYGKSVGGGILLFGLPGTGKTMFAQAVATELDAKFFSVRCSDIQSKWYGEAEKNVRDLFAKARACQRAVIFFDEFDSLGGRRTESNQDSASTVQEILTQMQGVEKNKNMLLVIAATNCPWALDGALLRPGRFNEKIYIPLPDKQAILFILKKELKGCPMTSDIDLSSIADRLVGCNGADIVEFCEKIKMKLIREEIEYNADNSKPKPEIDKDELNEILSKTKSSVLPRDVIQIEKFLGHN